MTNQAYTLKFAYVGLDVVIWSLAKIVSPDVISIGNSVIIDDFVFIMGGQETVIGDFVHIASFASCTGGGRFGIADFSSLSSGVRIFTGKEDFSGDTMTNPTVPCTYRQKTRSHVRIEKHAVIGANAVILPGVTIGEGAIISPNSVVACDCKPWTIYIGNPARPVRPRPSQRILELEQRLRAEVYTADGVYIPTRQR